MSKNQGEVARYNYVQGHHDSITSTTILSTWSFYHEKEFWDTRLK